MKKITIHTLVQLALLVAVEIVLSRFCSINAWNTKIGFNFLPTALAAILYGPFCAAIVAALGDFLGAVLFPIGPYFPGFTITAFLTGLLFGVFLRKDPSIFRICACVAVKELVLGLLLNTFWLSFLYKSPFFPLFLSRIFPQCVVLIVIEFLLLRVLVRTVRVHGRGLLT
ncbi:MAG: folate family ECF transporter S component [Oscillospiraceae bacterium]|nr:folate family ECF transporter S component [Oscillospiraceae bacterium]